jgi:hypothetical protein
MAADSNEEHFPMKPQTANDIDQRRAAAKRTALIVGAIAIFLFALSIIEVAIQK